MTGPKISNTKELPMPKKQRKFSLGTEMLKKLRRKSGDQESTTAPDLLASGNNNPTIASAISGDASDPINLCSAVEIRSPPLKNSGNIHKHLSQTLRMVSTGFCKHVVYGGYIYRNRYITVPRLHKMLTDIETKLQGRLQTPDLTRSKITPENTPLLIIDARRPDEYAISHIPGAVNIHTLLARRVSRYLQNVDLATPVLTYCAAGLRSGWLASRLRSLGFKNVKTLEGAFYQWASDGRPMVGDSGEIVYEVLPQHFLAAFLLEKQIRTVARKAVEEIEEHLPMPALPSNSVHFSEPLFKVEKNESASVGRNHSITLC